MTEESCRYIIRFRATNGEWQEGPITDLIEEAEADEADPDDPLSDEDHIEMSRETITENVEGILIERTVVLLFERPSGKRYRQILSEAQ